MWNAIMIGALLVAAPAAQQTDTTVAVNPRARLRMEDVRGRVVIHTWTRPEVRVHLSGADGNHLRVSASASTVTVGLESPSGVWGRNRRGDFDVTIPATMSVGVRGVRADVRIDGVQGEVTVESVQGDIDVTGGGGIISLRSVSGDVALRRARGQVDLHSVSGDLRLSDVAGGMIAETISGDIDVQRANAANVQASTVSGDLRYQGTVNNGGRYSLTSHSGDLTFVMPPGAGATISVSTFSGDFDTAIPLQLNEQQGKRFRFTLGSGAARVELQSFSGDIRLARPGASASAH